MLRPQRVPEAAEDFNCWVVAVNADGEPTTHKLSSLTPMPNVEQYRPERAWVPTDTWVELTFADESGAELPVIRRGQGRSPQGKWSKRHLTCRVLGVDPVAVRIGTIMPGLLPLIKVGSESELGRAVSQLTGLSALVDLAEHARRAKARIREFVKTKTGERDRADRDYGTVKGDLEKIMLAHPSLKPEEDIPWSSDDTGIEPVLDKVTKHLEHAKASAFESARDILGGRSTLTILRFYGILRRTLAARLNGQANRSTFLRPLGFRLRQLKPEQLDAADATILEILAEARALDALAQNPTAAARSRLYARRSDLDADHPDPQRKDDTCVICGGNLECARDPVTGQLVKSHLHEAAADAALLSQTLGRWADNAHGDLMRDMPEALRAEMATDLPAHPSDLLRSAIVDELFGFEPFSSILGDLKTQTASIFDEIVKSRTALSDPAKIVLPKGCDTLGATLERLDRAIRFARWRQGNDTFARDILTRVLGRTPKMNGPPKGHAHRQAARS